MTPKGILTPPGDDPHWYKDAIIYELHVRAFFDSNDDGTGDFRGLTEKLDYLRDLGITAIWLLPFYPSPLRDDGYDIADYSGVHPDYGTRRDVRRLLREAHRRGLRVITELVVNHTSDQHPWFQRARRAPKGSSWRDFYVWSDDPGRYGDTRVIFQDFETSNWSWDPVAEQYFWHRFYSHQPDLNYDNPRVRAAVLKAMSTWFEMGVDGLRLDAVPYLYEREGTSCENLPETHEFLKHLRREVDERFSHRMLLAEANQWPEDAAAYLGDGDECHMAFHFPVMPRLFMSVHMEDRFPLVDILEQTPEIPDSSQWALFLRNHDELTLEMVTDEERDYMYRVYAGDPRARVNVGIRRRLAPLLGNNRRKIELLNGFLFSLPGTPIIYYGDEIGMGDNYYLGDRNGVRTPMQWSPDRNAGFSKANPQRLYLPPIIDPEYHYEALNVEAQQQNPSSLLWWMRRLIALRQRFKAFGRGSLEMLQPDNTKIFAFIRRWEEDVVLVVANLSRFAQHVELDLSSERGSTPVELFGSTEFPPVGDDPYVLTLGPHSFFWFQLRAAERPVEPVAVRRSRERRAIRVRSRWDQVLAEAGRDQLAARLTEVLPERRWFGGKARTIKKITVPETVPMTMDGRQAWLALPRVDYTEGEGETYVLPLAVAVGAEAERISDEQPLAPIAELVRQTDDERALLYDPSGEPEFAGALLDAIDRKRRFKGPGGEIVATTARGIRRLRRAEDDLSPSIVRSEQSNTSVIFGQRYILKLFRRLTPGVNPDLEISRFLTAKGFAHTPAVVGTLELRTGRGEPATLGLLQVFVPNDGDAWAYTLDALGRYYERVVARPADEEADVPEGPLLDLAEEAPTDLACELIDTYLDSAWLLGRRTAEMHAVLASDDSDPAFAPERLTGLTQRSLYQSLRSQAGRSLTLLRRRLRHLPEAAIEDAEAVMGRRDEIMARLDSLRTTRVAARRIRTHGDYHLGQVLHSGRDFVIIDFEGEPARPLGERRLRRSPLRDVAGMLRSFHYAAHVAMQEAIDRGLVREEGRRRIESWTRYWYRWVSATYLRAYLEVTTESGLLPNQREPLEVLLDAFVLDKAMYELAYELGNRPDWVRIPLRGILNLLEEGT